MELDNMIYYFYDLIYSNGSIYMILSMILVKISMGCSLNLNDTVHLVESLN